MVCDCRHRVRPYRSRAMFSVQTAYSDPGSAKPRFVCADHYRLKFLGIGTQRCIRIKHRALSLSKQCQRSKTVPEHLSIISERFWHTVRGPAGREKNAWSPSARSCKAVYSICRSECGGLEELVYYVVSRDGFLC